MLTTGFGVDRQTGNKSAFFLFSFLCVLRRGISPSPGASPGAELIEEVVGMENGKERC